MTFKRYHLEGGFSEEHYDWMLPDPKPTPRQQHLDCQQLTPPPLIPVPASPACVKTFNIPELAEDIFLHLSPENLLCWVQRVCRQWRRTVETSELIQQYLFFRPIPYSCEPVQKRALLSTGGLEHHDGEMEDFETWTSGAPILENPWFYLFSHEGNQATRLHRYPEASWRRMLLTQPPQEYATGRVLRIQNSALYKDQWCSHWQMWEPVRHFDTVRKAKKLRRQDETFVELDLAD